VRRSSPSVLKTACVNRARSCVLFFLFISSNFLVFPHTIFMVQIQYRYRMPRRTRVYITSMSDIIPFLCTGNGRTTHGMLTRLHVHTVVHDMYSR
jgi:hypothetical protein